MERLSNAEKPNKNIKNQPNPFTQNSDPGTMSSKPTSKSSKQNVAEQRKQNIPVQLTDLSIFDNTFAFMKERFNQEMKRIEQQMDQFSTDLMQFYGETSNVQTGLVSSMPEDVASNWEILASSPLVQGKEDDKTLKLQFDVSQFDPSEVKVNVLNDILIITANHEEKTEDTTIYREYNRQFKLPPGTDPELVASTLSRDGVLTVLAPLPKPVTKSILAVPD